MNERDLQLARAMVDLELDENAPKKTIVIKMHDKQQTFSNTRCELTVDYLEAVEPRSVIDTRRGYWFPSVREQVSPVGSRKLIQFTVVLAAFIYDHRRQTGSKIIFLVTIIRNDITL